jgi:hypothetical protein
MTHREVHPVVFAEDWKYGWKLFTDPIKTGTGKVSQVPVFILASPRGVEPRLQA